MMNVEDNSEDTQDNITSQLPAGVVPGSQEAKTWWIEHVETPSKAAITPELKAKWGDKLTGMYEGKPLIPGPGADHGDMNYLVDKLIITQGLSPEVATKIVAKAYWKNNISK